MKGEIRQNYRGVGNSRVSVGCLRGGVIKNKLNFLIAKKLELSGMRYVANNGNLKIQNLVIRRRILSEFWKIP